MPRKNTAPRGGCLVGLVHGRNNDVGGYWAQGVLYIDAAAGALQTRKVIPSGAQCIAVLMRLFFIDQHR